MIRHNGCSSYFRIPVRTLQSSAVSLIPAAKENYIKHHSQVTKPTETHNFLNNQFIQSTTTKWIDLRDPATQNLVTRVPESTTEELREAVDSAESAFKTWKNTSLLTRQQVMFRLASLIRENMDRLAASVTLEQVTHTRLCLYREKRSRMQREMFYVDYKLSKRPPPYHLK
jgi:malonate-semialdehyde dehydrogenase (acetylating) / methylmalonate-semialdehyde dehydrogenase